MIRVYRKKNFEIYSGNTSFIVRNTDKEFQDGHSHIQNFKTAKYIIDLCIHKSIPHHLNTYLLTSLIRLTDDDVYRNKIDTLVNSKINNLKRNNNKYINAKKR